MLHKKTDDQFQLKMHVSMKSIGFRMQIHDEMKKKTGGNHLKAEQNKRKQTMKG